VSQKRYFELYRQFLNHTISKEDYEDLMNWVADETNDAALRRYMTVIWGEENWEVEGQPENWSEFKDKILKHRTQRSTSKTVFLPRIWYYAASVALLLGLVFGLYHYSQPGTILFHTAYGETQSIPLDDGSVVTLNANSTLEWDEGWKRSGERRVKLTGEAYFDVEHTPDDATFTVETNDLKIKVLGTTFNVSSRRDKTDVTLETGKIELDLKGSSDKILEMEPGDRVNFSAVNNTLKKEKVLANTESTNWMDGVLRFENVSVEEMFREIEDLYGKKLMSKDSSLLNRRMFTGIPYEDWNVAKQALELALGVKIEERNNELYVK